MGSAGSDGSRSWARKDWMGKRTHATDLVTSSKKGAGRRTWSQVAGCCTGKWAQRDHRCPLLENVVDDTAEAIVGPDP